MPKDKNRKIKFVAKADGTHVREEIVECAQNTTPQQLEIPSRLAVKTKTPSEMVLSAEFPELVSLPVFPDPSACFEAVQEPQNCERVHLRAVIPRIQEPENSESSSGEGTPRQRSRTAPDYWASIDESMKELPTVISQGRHRQRFYTHAYDVDGAKLNFAKEV
jgi:hypothetical protein